MSATSRTVALAFGATLRAARKKQGVSQDRLAALCGFDRTYPSLMERGLRQPSLALTTVEDVSRSHRRRLSLRFGWLPRKGRRRVHEYAGADAHFAIRFARAALQAAHIRVRLQKKFFPPRMDAIAQRAERTLRHVGIARGLLEHGMPPWLRRRLPSSYPTTSTANFNDRRQIC